LPFGPLLTAACLLEQSIGSIIEFLQLVTRHDLLRQRLELLAIAICLADEAFQLSKFLRARCLVLMQLR
jgi:hypothetical protein